MNETLRTWVIGAFLLLILLAPTGLTLLFGGDYCPPTVTTFQYLPALTVGVPVQAVTGAPATLGVPRTQSAGADLPTVRGPGVTPSGVIQARCASCHQEGVKTSGGVRLLDRTGNFAP